MTNISCDIIKDLLPLYYDEICSCESKKMVEEHLAECSNCQSELDKMKIDIDVPKEVIEENRREGNGIKNIAIFLKHLKVKVFIKGLVIATVLLTFVFLGYIGLFHWNIETVPMDAIEISDVCQLEDGRIAYYVKVTDGYDINECRFQMDGKGAFYYTPYRTIVKEKRKYPGGLADMYYIFDDVIKSIYQDKYGDNAEIKALYYGTPEDSILIWEKGMDLPRASKDIEEKFDYK